MQDGAPGFEFADDYTAYSEGRAAHARRHNYAEQLIRALTLHAAPATQREPTRDSHEAHLRSVDHFAGVVRRGREHAALYGLPRPRITPSLARAMSARGVLVSEVEAAV